MGRIGELLKRGPTEQEQQRVDTKRVFGEISDLAPHQKAQYVSSSLSSLILSNGNIRIVTRLLDLHEGDPLAVLPVSTEEPLSSIMINNNRTGMNSLCVDYHSKTFEMKRIRPDNEPLFTRDQSLLLNLFGIMRDDLETRRLQWKESIEKQRREFKDQLYPQETTAIAHILEAISLTSTEQYSVFGSIEDQEENAGDGEDNQQSTRTVRLFITSSLDQEIASDIAESMSIESPPLKQAYSRDLTQPKIEIDGFDVDTRKLILNYPGFEVHIENFWPVHDREMSTLLQQNDDRISEDLFKAFMSGSEQGFRPLTSSKEPVLLDKESENDENFFAEAFTEGSSKDTEVA